ncbi:MAG: hypothetical protein ACRDXX_12985 [Stackebrandtia sp.]
MTTLQAAPRPGALLVAWEMFRDTVKIAGYLWLAMAALLTVTVAVFHDAQFGSLWAGLAGAPRIYLLVMGIVTAGVMLRLYVAVGRTRREYLLGGLIHGPASGAVLTLAVLAGLGLERLTYAVVGGEQFPAGGDLFSSVEAMAAGTVALFTTNTAFYFSGWLIGAGFYRLHWLIGLILIVPAAAPMLMVTDVSAAEGGGFRGGFEIGARQTLESGHATSSAWLAAGVAFAALAAAGVWLLLRDAPIKPPRIV